MMSSRWNALDIGRGKRAWTSARSQGLGVFLLLLAVSPGGSAPGQVPHGGYTTIAESGERFASVDLPAINAAGQVAFTAHRVGSGTGLYRGDGRSITTIAETGERFSEIGYTPSIGPDGGVSFHAKEVGGHSGIYHGRGDGKVDEVFTAAGADPLIGAEPRIDDTGRTIFTVQRSKAGTSILAWKAGRLETLLDAGREPKRSYTFRGLGSGGRVLFSTYDEGVEELSVLEGQAIRRAARANSTINQFGGATCDAEGTVLCMGYARDGAPVIVLIPREGPPRLLADTRGPYGNLGNRLWMTARGETVFSGSLKSGFGGLFTGPDPRRDEFLGRLDGLPGGRATLRSTGGVNGAGQVAIVAALASGRRAILRREAGADGVVAGAARAFDAAAAAPATAVPAPGPMLVPEPTGARSVILKAPDLTKSIGGGRLALELFRQALLIAASDELEIPARDEALGEAAGDGAAVLDLRAEIRPGQYVQVTAEVLTPQGSRDICFAKRPLPNGPEVDYAALAEMADGLARNEFREGLRRIGLRNDSKPGPAAAGALPRELRARIELADVLSGFAALRALHAATSARSRDTERLGALCRAYAHQGLLTDSYWVPVHQAYQARSLLWAQRMIGVRPGDPGPLRHRAYALALAGAHRLAAADLESARGLPGGATGSPPAWVPLIEAAVRFDDGALAKPPADRALVPLAALLRFRAVEPFRSSRLLDEAGLAAVQADPELYGVYDGLVRGSASLGLLHRTTVVGPQVLSAALPKRLAGMPGLPAGVSKALEAGDEPAAVQALAAAGGDDGSAAPSWGALARIIRESRFLLAFDRLDFMAHMWSVPVAEALEEARPLVADHPLAAYLDAIGAERTPGYTAALRRVTPDFGTMGLNALPLLGALTRAGASPGDTAIRQADATNRDLSLLILAVAARVKGSAARRLLDVSPHSPFAATRLIGDDWAYAEPRAGDWEKSHAAHPAVLLALGRRYLGLKRWDDAERCIRAAIRVSPEYAAYRMLADLYRARGQLDRWRETLEEFLKQEDAGLQSDRVRTEIAYGLMQEGQFAEAEPYAAEAAESYAAWAMICASDCYEGLGRWEPAELWIRRTSERYEPSAADWYFWCRRTERGDEAAARQRAERWATVLEASLPPNLVREVAYFRLLTGDAKRAHDLFYPGHYASNDAIDKLHLALITTNPDERASVADDVIRSEPAAAPLAELFRPGVDLKAGIAEVDRQRAGLDPLMRREWAYFLGRLAQQKGLTAEAESHLKEAAGVQATALTRTLAAIALRELGPGADRKP